MPSRASSYSDVGSVLWFNIADLSDHCTVISLQTLEAGLSKWPSFTGMEHSTPHKELDTWPRVLKEKWREERAGNCSLNFFQAVSTCVVVESSQPLAAESMSSR